MDRGWDLAKSGSLYVILPVLALVYGLALYLDRSERKNGRKTPETRIFLAAMLVVYLLVYIWLTFIHRLSLTERSSMLGLFWSYREAFSFEGGLHVVRLGLARQILLNILVYIPAGLLLPLAFRRTGHPWLWTAAACAALSALTEGLQYLTLRGLCELDDLFNNMLGCAIGIGLLAGGRAILHRLERRRPRTAE